MSVLEQIGEKDVIETVGELKQFIAGLDDDMRLDLDFLEPVEIYVMRDRDTGEEFLTMVEECA